MGCAERPAPTIARLLSGHVRALEEQSLRRYVFIAHETEVPFRLDESGTVSCGGVPGISDTFASALWGVSYLTQAMRIGAAGINLQGNPTNCLGYTPVCAQSAEAAATGALEARPEWYALLLARGLLGERPLRTTVGPANRPNVVASAFRAADGTTKFVLIDDDAPGARSVAMRLHVGAGFGGATILSLTAPSPDALTGVELGGRAVAANGSWSQPAVLPRAANQNGVITVDVAPSSAALVTVERARKKPARHHRKRSRRAAREGRWAAADAPGSPALAGVVGDLADHFPARLQRGEEVRRLVGGETVRRIRSS